ncbi:hypothetical protein OE88DRAFT_47853 [Heliocybe sulcata]|uniref:Uncharacterized protein n=1 Tax=Heliocybe sulcata TaxID=5364 RepID=A0A5C3NH81_9AGAM|nr:hypothetical protein OE88DRAFT_47853 [Heliocybe sulcata]
MNVARSLCPRTNGALYLQGINVQDILKLKVMITHNSMSILNDYPHHKAAAINTVSGVNMTPRRQLLKIKGMSEAKVEKIKEAAHKILGSSFATGLDVQDKRKRVLAISTGSKSVDAILGGASTAGTGTLFNRITGGIMSQSISEGADYLYLGPSVSLT